MTQNSDRISLKPGKRGVPLHKLQIPSGSGKKRPVSSASWRTVGTPFTPYAGVVSFVTRQILRVEIPQLIGEKPKTLENGQAL